MTGALYIHIPFCRRRCGYCDFYSTVCADESIQSATVERIIQQAELIAERFSPTLSSVYIGGGTPSALPLPILERLFNALGRLFTLSAECEVTVEANPETSGEAFLRFLKTTPVNRLSLGIQSFDDRVLQLLGRDSSRRTALKAVERAAANGPARLNLDFISEIPGVSEALTVDDIRTAASFRPSHISVYALSVPEGSALEKRLAGREISSCVEEAFNEAAAFGYERYEISNCALPGGESRHNLAYWRMEPFWGCGPSASGTFPNGTGRVCRREGVSPLEAFLSAEPEKSWTEEILTPRDLLFETVMMGCRLKEGIALDDFYRKTGRVLRDAAPKTVARALKAGLFREENGRFLPTAEGWRWLNRFLVDFLSELDSTL